MSSGAPAGERVKSIGSTLMAQCELAIPDTCMCPDAPGPVQICLVVKTKKQINACISCKEQLVLAGQWIIVP